MLFFISYPFFVLSSIEIISIYLYIHFSYHKRGKDHRFYPVIQITLTTPLVKTKVCCVRDGMLVFSFKAYSSRKGDEELPGRRGMLFLPPEFSPTFQSVTEAAVTVTEKSSIHISGKEPTKRSRSTRSWGPLTWALFFSVYILEKQY